MLSMQFGVSQQSNDELFSDEDFCFDEVNDGMWRFETTGQLQAPAVAFLKNRLANAWETNTTQVINNRDRAESEALANALRQVFLTRFPTVAPPIEARRPRPSGENPEIASLARGLHDLKDPRASAGDKASIKRFKLIEGMVRDLLDSPRARLKFPCGERDFGIVVEDGGNRIGFESQGSGLQQVLFLAYRMFSNDGPVLLIEEPETHLNPRLHKKLLNYLSRLDNHVSFIATHSPFMIGPDSPPNTCIVRLWRESGNGRTMSDINDANSATMQTLRDLGVSASDVLQARYVIWVEGPSDAIYLRAWIRKGADGHPRKLAAQQLVEGIDYAFAFYGGALLSHISAADDDGSRVMALLNLSRSGTIVMDSDRRPANSDRLGNMDKAKRRVGEECSKDKSISAWITSGREIENYLLPSAVAKAYGPKIDATTLAIPQFESLSDCLRNAWIGDCSGDPYSPKSEWSKAIADSMVMIQTEEDVLGPLDLRMQIDELLNRIIDANPMGAESVAQLPAA
jgi:hypothetical protein